MKYTAALLSYALFATSALSAVATPRSRSTLDERIARRKAGRMSKPNQRIFDGTATNDTNVSYSSNWSGAVLTSPPSGQTFNSVSASFVVPSPKVPSGKSSSGSYSASAWVGIDGDTYQNSILQTGIDFTISNGQVSYDAWYEWFPDYAYDFSGIPISAGDTITASVVASSSTAGKAVIQNVSKGKTVSKSLTSSAALGGQNAEWIVEDYEQNGSLVPLANFGTVTFTGVSAKTAQQSVGLSGATILDLKQGSTIYSSASESGSTVTVKYV